MRTLGIILAGVLLSATAQAEPICHVKGNGGSVQIDVNANALDAHAQHGDWDTVTLYADADGDGLGDPNPDNAVESCSASLDGYVGNADDPDDTNAGPAACIGLTGDPYFAAHTSSQYVITSCSADGGGQKYTATCLSNCESEETGPYEGGYGTQGTWTTGDNPGDWYPTYGYDGGLTVLTPQQLQACQSVFAAICP